MSEKYGSDLGGVYAFPTAEQLSDVTEEDFRRLRVGFRAKYLADAMEKIKSGENKPGKNKNHGFGNGEKISYENKGRRPESGGLRFAVFLPKVRMCAYGRVDEKGGGGVFP